MSSGSLAGRGVWGRTDTCVYVVGGSSIPPLPSFSLQFGRFGAILGMEGDSLQYKMACVDNVYVCDTHLFYYLQMSENAVLSPGK